MTHFCESCRHYKYSHLDEFVGKIGQCRYNPPVYIHKEYNNFPRVRADAWCGKWKEGQ